MAFLYPHSQALIDLRYFDNWFICFSFFYSCLPHGVKVSTTCKLQKILIFYSDRQSCQWSSCRQYKTHFFQGKFHLKKDTLPDTFFISYFSSPTPEIINFVLIVRHARLQMVSRLVNFICGPKFKINLVPFLTWWDGYIYRIQTKKIFNFEPHTKVAFMVASFELAVEAVLALRN